MRYKVYTVGMYSYNVHNQVDGMLCDIVDSVCYGDAADASGPAARSQRRAADGRRWSGRALC